MNNDNAPLLPMPIKVKPYAHQINAFDFICEKLGLLPGSTYSPAGYGAALLMEMGTGKTDMSPVKWTVFSRINSFVRRITKYFFHAALANNFLL